MSEDSMVCIGTIIGCAVLALRIIAIGCSASCQSIFEDDDFVSNCIEPTNINIIQPSEGEFAALSLVPIFACVLACILACCYNQCEECVTGTLGCALVVELLVYVILFAHIGAYLFNLDDIFGDNSCSTYNNFNSAVNWTKTGLIISVILVGLPCCIAFVAACFSVLNDDSSTNVSSKTISNNTPTKPVVVVQEPPSTNNGAGGQLTQRQQRIVNTLMSAKVIEQCGFTIATDSKKASILQALKQQTPSGQTALRDAVIYGLVKMFALKMVLNKFNVIGHKFVHIVLTDGMDNKSSSSPHEIKEMFQLIGQKIGVAYGKTFFIGIDLGVSEKKALQNIADIAGNAAELFHCQDVELKDIFERIKINVGLQRRLLAVSNGENAVLMSEDRLFLQPERQKFLVLFSLDKSGSMSGKRWRILQTALYSFFQGLDASDIIGCVLFNDKVECITDTK